jgi:hypothetical protein
MANSKISALTSASTPLAGTETLPVVQSGSTVKVSVADLTTGRAISATEMTLSTGNLVIGTSGKGIDFSATPGTGTSELLNDYEEGNFTPTIVGTTTAGVGNYAFQVGKYTKIGREVSFELLLVWAGHTGTGNMYVAGLPFSNPNYAPPVGIVCFNMVFLGQLAGYVNGTNIDLLQLFTDASYTAVAMDTNVSELRISGTYTA